MYKMTQISIIINNILYLTPIERYEYLSSCCHNNKDDLKHHTCICIYVYMFTTNICKYMYNTKLLLSYYYYYIIYFYRLARPHFILHPNMAI